MTGVNLLRVFEFYLTVMFLAGLIRRWAIYRDTIILIFAVRGRWPRVLERLAEHRDHFLTWSTVRPTTVALGVLLIQMIASRLIWPQATVTLDDLLTTWWKLPVMGIAVLPMLAIDAYFLLRVGGFDRSEAEQYLDYAERWAGSWRARVVRVATFGRIDPDRMVDDEIKKGLTQFGRTVSSSMWWTSAQAVARLSVGLTLWLLWAFGG